MAFWKRIKLKIIFEILSNSKKLIYNNFAVLGLSKPNIGLVIAFWLTLIIYSGVIITLTKIVIGII